MDPEFQKFNQHYVPRFWQRRFADSKGQLYGRYESSSDPDQSPAKRGRSRIVGVVDTMTQDFTYTVFDQHFRPYDILENLLSKAEGHMRQVQDEVLDPYTHVGAELRAAFCWGVALSICRLPHIMKRLHRRRIELAFTLSEVSLLDRSTFDVRLASFGQVLTDEEYEALKASPIENLIETADRLSKLSPQDPEFPEQDALQGIDALSRMLRQMDLTIVDSAGDPFFIIGDTPMPDYDLARGFTLPLSKTAAARFGPLAASATFSRQSLSKAAVEAVNQEQYDNSVTHVIGPDPAYLDSLSPSSS